MPAKPERNLHLYLIAGEQSGDLLGARLMRALKQVVGDDVLLTFAGIGGPNMEAEGLQSRIHMRELALMGFAEIIPHIPRLLKHISATAEDILMQQPDAIITIDSPGFNSRVVKACRKEWPKGAGAPPFIHYVAPSVWAYKPGRAKKLASLYEHVLTLLPFEPDCFTREGMGASFVGHPVVETAEQMAQADAASFRTHHYIRADAPLMTMLPGSRLGELKQHLPILRRTTALLLESRPNLAVAMPVVPHLKDALAQMTENWPVPLAIITDEQERWDAFAASDVALAKSGTVTLELALMKTPMAVFYKVNPLSAWLMKRLLRTRFVTLVNILLNKPVIPELLQKSATPENLANAALKLLEDEPTRQNQLDAANDALQMLGLHETKTPSQRAAESILKLLG